VEDQAFAGRIRHQLQAADFIMLRWETELTPCTGITAVSRQERRHFRRGVTVAPWCGQMTRKTEADNPLDSGSVRHLGWGFEVAGKRCQVLATADEALPPILYLDVEGRFTGRATPYDVEPEQPEMDRVATLRRDALYFGLAVERLLAEAGCASQFLWGADWETVPALLRLRPRHLIALTLHNTFDECFEPQAREFGAEYGMLLEQRPGSGETRTALEMALDLADVVTTVNRGFSHGMRSEPLQREIMMNHIPWHLIDRVVGIDNAAFSPLNAELVSLSARLERDFSQGCQELFARKATARGKLATQGIHSAGKVMVVAMGRRSAQKQHDVLVEATRQLLTEQPELPIYIVFATTPEDGGQPRLEQMKQLAAEYPRRVACFDGRINFYADLMAGADYNCMPSLYEPHGGAYEGLVIPIARAVDGLAEQICPLHPGPEAAAVAGPWHTAGEEPSGLLFREPENSTSTLVADLRALLESSPSPHNALFQGMVAALKATLTEAIDLRLHRWENYAELVRAALRRQQESSWLANLGGMTALVEQARGRRPLN
jgi:glycogen synthase